MPRFEHDVTFLNSHLCINRIRRKYELANNMATKQKNEAVTAEKAAAGEL